MKKRLLNILILCLFTSTMFSQISWNQAKITSDEAAILKDRNIPTSAKIFSFDLNELQSQLANAPLRGSYNGISNTVIIIPDATGNMLRYAVEEAPVFAPELQAKYPEIRAYAAYGIDDKSAYLRFTVSPYNGLNGIVLAGDRSETIIIESAPQNTSKAIIFNRSERTTIKMPFECSTDDQFTSTEDKFTANRIQAADDSILRTFDLAMSVTGEYSAFHGGTLPLVNAAIATTIARNNSIFEIDFAVTLVLIASNDNVVYLDGATDPYNSTSDANYNSVLQSTLTTQIGEANYDIGHLMGGIGNNGNAGCIGCICVNGSKGSGYTTSTNPIGDTFDVDYVAHEFGHQFGANHTFTHSSEGAGVAQMEPGSGSTIMSYAGITGATDVQPNVDPYFHAISIDQITTHAKSRTCDVETATGNNIPVVNAGANITLPIGTPFFLSGSATDGDGADVLTYCWEQYNEENAANAYPDPAAANNNRPLFRSYNPTTSTDRTFPKLEDLLANGVNGNVWEKVPTVGRTADFRLTVRDNRAGGAGNSFDDMLVTWDATRGPFEITSQATSGVSWTSGTTENITWNVNNTDVMTGASNVDILLSTDGGLTYPTALASNVSNNGAATITVPNNPAPYCRIMIKPTGAQFFAINTVDFAIDYMVSTTCDERFTSNPAIAIPDNGGAFETVGLASTSTKTFGNGVFLKININATHTWIGDLRFDILSPDGTQLSMYNQGCNGGDEDMDVIFFDDGGALVCATPVVGDVQPIELFSALDGETAGGTWTLGYVDQADVDTGTLNSWYVEICETTTSALSIDNQDFTIFNVYPNPTNGMVNISLSTFEDVKVTLYDISGRQIYSKTLENNSNTFNENIDLSGIASGVYLLNVKSGSKTATKKLVIQ